MISHASNKDENEALNATWIIKIQIQKLHSWILVQQGDPEIHILNHLTNLYSRIVITEN